MGEFERAKWPRQIIGAVVVGCAIAGLWVLPNFLFGDFTGPIEVQFLSLPFLLLSLVLVTMVVIWFGAWGILAAFLVVLALAFGEGSVFLIVSVIQALIPAWAFRRFKSDPRLIAEEDIKVFIVYDLILASLAVTLVFQVARLFYGIVNTFFDLIFSSIMILIIIFVIKAVFDTWVLRLASKIVIKARAYCRGWFS